MNRILAGSLAWLAVAFSSAQAAPVFFSGLPATYVPGDPLEFSIGLPPIADLGSYDIDIVLSSDEGIAGTDFAFDLAATGAVSPGDGYVFPSTASFFDAVSTPTPNQQRLTASDFDFAGVEVLAGVNDKTVGVVVVTDPGFTGALTLSIDADSLILDRSSPAFTPIEGFPEIVSATRASGTATLPSVPEPSSVLVAWSALLIIQSRRSCRFT